MKRYGGFTEQKQISTPEFQSNMVHSLFYAKHDQLKFWCWLEKVASDSGGTQAGTQSIEDELQITNSYSIHK